MAFCTKCAFNLPPDADFCPQCGTEVKVYPTTPPPSQQTPQAPQVAGHPPNVIIVQASQSQGVYNPDKPKKSKIIAAMLAIFLGWLGAHKFYLRKTSGALYPIFWIVPLILLSNLFPSQQPSQEEEGAIYSCMGCILVIVTALPFIISISEGIKYLAQEDEIFDKAFNPQCFK
jgi:TM2 domain-containing membrane protein YozV